MMFEIVIFGVIFLAACYWAVLWLMGRRGGEQARPVVAARPEFPPRPAPPKAALPQPAFRQERLDSLLDEIKQDLTQLVMRK